MSGLDIHVGRDVMRRRRDVPRVVPRSGASAAFAMALLLLPALSHGLLAQARAAAPAVSRTTPAAQAVPSPLVLRAADALVTIVVYRDGAADVTSGVGLRLPDGRVLTSLRHLRGAAKVECFNAAGEKLGEATLLEQADARLDIGIIGQLAGPGGRFTLARRGAAVAQRVTVLEPRQGHAPVITSRTVTHIEPDSAGRVVLRVGAPVASGAAGSPVVNARGELVAVAVGTLVGRDENDAAVDVGAVRELVARPATRLAFPGRDGSIATARAASTDAKPTAMGTAAARTAEAPRPRASIFPDRYGPALGADTVKTWVVELFGCARLESRQRVYCYLRITNLAPAATFNVSGGDLADSTRRTLRSAENLVTADGAQKVAGWRTKAAVPLRELESTRVALEFPLPEKDVDAVRLMVDVSGERALWFGPFVLQRAP